MKRYHYISKGDFPDEYEKVLGFIIHPHLPIKYAEVVFMINGVWYGNTPWEHIYKIDEAYTYAWQEISYPKKT